LRRIAAALLGLAAAVACAGHRSAPAPEAEGRAWIPAWELPPPPPRDAPVVAGGAVQRLDLDNGLRIILLEDHRLPRISLALHVRRGEASVPPELAGLAAFTGSLMERGAGARDAQALAWAVEELGASLAVYSDWDAMGVGISGLARDRDRLLELLADVALRPRFEAAEAERLRGETLAWLARAADDPATLAGWWTARALYPGHRYGEPQGGVPASVARLDADRARSLHRRFFVPGNAVVSASGDFDPEELLARLGELFGAWSGGDPPPPGPPPPAPAPAARKVLIVDRPELEQSRIALAHDGIERSYPERIEVSLLNSVLGGSGFSSRLTRRVRSEAGLTYGVGSHFDQRRSPGPFVVSTFTRVPETRRVIDLLLAELERIAAEPPDAQELRDAQTLAAGHFALGLETSDAVVATLVELDVYDLPEDSIDTYRARVRAVTTEDTARVARALVHPQRAAIVLVGPADALRPQVQDLGPVEVVDPLAPRP